MATLWWTSTHYTLSSALQNVGELKQVIGQKLPSLGYTGVQVAGDVHGFKGQFLLAVQYLPIGGSNFWQVVAAGGDGASPTPRRKSPRWKR